MRRLIPVAPTVGLALFASMLSASARGPYDGTWQVDTPRATGTANPTNPVGCDANRVVMQIKDSKISGNLERSATGRGRVENTTGGLPITGTVAPDGTVNAHWETLDIVGRLTGDSGELRFRSDCGPRVATAKRISAD